MSAVVESRIGQEMSLAECLYHKVQEYYQDPQHRREFDRWYKKTYGKAYVWKHRKERAG